MPPLRRNGLHRPWHPRQVISILVFFYTTTLFFSLIIPSISPIYLQTILGLIYLLIFLLGLITFYQTSHIDPMLTRSTPAFQRLATRCASGNTPAGVRYCTTCSDYMPPRTKHCKLCAKCVQVFDHHCLYLNTCIGAANYKPFFLLVSLCLLLLSLHITITVFLITSRALADWRWALLCGALSAPVLGVWGGVGTLWGFHAYIQVLGVTTYEWLTGQKPPTTTVFEEESGGRREEEMVRRVSGVLGVGDVEQVADGNDTTQ